MLENTQNIIQFNQFKNTQNGISDQTIFVVTFLIFESLHLAQDLLCKINMGGNVCLSKRQCEFRHYI